MWFGCDFDSPHGNMLIIALCNIYIKKKIFFFAAWYVGILVSQPGIEPALPAFGSMEF